MIVRGIVKRSTYRDSVTLMKISNYATNLKGVSQAAVVMATALNMKLLKDTGLLTPDIENASSNDLVIAVSAESEEALRATFAEAERLLSAAQAEESMEFMPKTLDSALSMIPEANLVLISVPGQFAKREALKALKKGLNVFLFSSNVSLKEELELKTLASEKGLLMMGPDCGTAIINNVVLGFGNVVRQGSVGIVSASGTGLQQVSTLVHDEGFGISQAIGVGGRDLSQEIGGIMMLDGIKLLSKHKKTRVIVLISKMPHPSMSQRIIKVATHTKKPVVINFLGGTLEGKPEGGPIMVDTLEDAAKAACALVRGEKPKKTVFTHPMQHIKSIVNSEIRKMAPEQKYLRGLFSGGTLCGEAQVVLSPLIGDIYSNTPLKPEYKLDANKSKQHCCIDMGSEEFVVGKPHPMIDFDLRKRRIVQEAKDPETAVILLDVVLGYGSNMDPASELAPVIKEGKSIAKQKGRFLSFVTSVLGTVADPQNLTKQEKKLKRVGAITMPTNAQAARIAALIATRYATKVEILKRADS